jgi:RNA polymerase sigma factor (sigma-70 family)
MQAGRLGLMRAAAKFDPNRGSFAFFAKWFVEREIREHLRCYLGAVKRPRGERLKIDGELNVPAHPDSDEDKVDTLTDEVDTTVLELRKLQKIATDVLDQREARIVRERFFSDDPKILSQVGAELNLSAERVRQIELGAIQKIKADIVNRLEQDRAAAAYAAAHAAAHRTNFRFRHLAWAAHGGHKINFADDHRHLLSDEERAQIFAVAVVLARGGELDKTQREQLDGIVCRLVQKIDAAKASVALSFKQPMRSNSSRLGDTLAKAERLRRAGVFKRAAPKSTQTESETPRWAL